MASLPNIPSTEKDPLKVATAIRQTVEKVNSLIGLTDGDKGDITVSADGATWEIDADAVGNTEIANMAAYTLKARNAGTTGDPSDMDISALTEKTSPVAADLVLIQDSAASNAFKKVQRSNFSAPPDAQYVTLAANAGLSAERTLTAGAGITITDAGANGAVTVATAAGTVLQVLQTTYATNADLTTATPADDTAPTISEGTEVLSLAITPADNSNKVLCKVELWGITITNVIVTAALFRGTTCINAAGLDGSTGGSGVQNIGITHLDSPASASAQTYSVRVGPASGTTRLNGTASARLYGGASACTLTLMEVAA